MHLSPNEGSTAQVASAKTKAHLNGGSLPETRGQQSRLRAAVSREGETVQCSGFRVQGAEGGKIIEGKILSNKNIARATVLTSCKQFSGLRPFPSVDVRAMKIRGATSEPSRQHAKNDFAPNDFANPSTAAAARP